MIIKSVEQTQKNKALTLILNTFLHFEAPDYTDEGINTFKALLHDKNFIDSLEMYGAFKDDEILGVIATRNSGSHIVLLFVDINHQRQGIATKLFHSTLKNFPAEIITVNASPFAVEAYKHLGFKATGNEQVKDGIRFTPMIFKI